MMIYIPLALMLGFKHSYDADHLLAVSNYIVKSRSVKNTAIMSASWAAGHTITASIVTVVLYQLKEVLLSQFLSYFEVVTAAMLIIFGIIAIASFFKIHVHKHSHKDEEHEHIHLHLSEEHYHKHMFGIGIIQGLASNDELLVLFTVSFGIASLAGIIAYVAVYSIGVIAGMVLFGVFLSYPVMKLSKTKLSKIVSTFVGVISLGYGLVMLAEIV